MQKRFLSIWFRYLHTDWFTKRQPELAQKAFVLARPSHGKMIISHTNAIAQTQGVLKDMAVADARAIIPSVIVLDDDPSISGIFLKGIAEWFIRFTPVVSPDAPDGLVLDVTGCTHLWGGDEGYIKTIYARLIKAGYTVRLAIADTIGCAWALARFGKNGSIIKPGGQIDALISLPASSLRIDAEMAHRLAKLGLFRVGHFITMPRTSLRRRFGEYLLQRIDEAAGTREEDIIPVNPVPLYSERLYCLEPIVTKTGIDIALNNLLDVLCKRLQHEQKGIRSLVFKGFRIDGKMVQISIGTLRASCNINHLYKLFENKIETIEPALGIELFVLEALHVEELHSRQEQLWEKNDGIDDVSLSELLDRISSKLVSCNIQRFRADEHYWPERSFKATSTLQEKPSTSWRTDRPRPLHLLSKPEPIEVTAPVPDYPPMLFRYKGQLHKIMKADGPERIEQEWWLQQGQHRDYYYVEDENGYRYWLFRSGHYDVERTYQWYMHGFFP